MKTNYDVIVVGGGTAGCAAAYTCAKLGLQTLLIEKNIHLGGTITSGLVVPVMKSGENQINTDFYNEFVAEMQAVNGQITYQDNSGWFNPELTKIILDKMMSNVGVETLLGVSNIKIVKSDRVIIGIEIPLKTLSAYIEPIQSAQDRLSVYIGARYIIDATGNCEIGKVCGCNFLENNKEFQPVSLRFMMSGINITEFANWLIDFDKDRNVTTVEYINGYTHLSSAYTWDNNKKWALAPLFDDAVNKGILEDTDRNYFQIFTVAGMPDTIAFNCPRIAYNIDPLNIEDTSKALVSARSSILRLSEFCKIYFPGFKDAYISNIADMLGIRVSRRIKGKYIYTINDLKSGKKFANPVVISNYPIDVHSSNKEASTLDKVGEYQLPIESLISADIDNLYVAGRCLSADFMAQGALRVQASCFSMGEGLAKYLYSLN